jgi:hypothetical protein
MARRNGGHPGIIVQLIVGKSHPEKIENVDSFSAALLPGFGSEDISF